MPTKPTSEIQHGSVSAYTNDGCRCEECRAGWASYARSYRATPRVKRDARKSALKRLYGLTPEEADALLARFGWRCAICGSDTRRLCLDHDHTTGRVRGILCHRCNGGLGMLGDTREQIERTLDYLNAGPDDIRTGGTT